MVVDGASLMIVSVVRPRKSILSMPAFSSAVHVVLRDDDVLVVAPAPAPLEACVHTGT